MYYPPHLNAVAFAAVPILVHHPPQAKRPLEPEEGGATGGKAKKARGGKAKAPESHGNGEFVYTSPISDNFNAS